MKKEYTTYTFENEILWDEIPEGKLEFSNWDSKISYDTRFKMGFVKGKGIYLRMHTDETDIRAVNTARDENIWEDSCMEFFICPFADRKEYLNFEINSKGAWLCQFGEGREGRVFLKSLTDCEAKLSTSVSTNGWSLELFVPSQLITEAYGKAFKAEACELRGNFYKCGDLTAVPHYDSFAKMGTLPPGFHNPECFAKIKITER